MEMMLPMATALRLSTHCCGAVPGWGTGYISLLKGVTLVPCSTILIGEHVGVSMACGGSIFMFYYYDSAQRSSAPPRTEYNIKQCNIQYNITI